MTINEGPKWEENGSCQCALPPIPPVTHSSSREALEPVVSKGGFAIWLPRLEVGESVDDVHAGDACVAAQARVLPLNEETSATDPL